MEPIPNVLAERYASPELREVWSPAGRVVLERRFWIAVLKAQRDLGLPVPAEAIAAYERAAEEVDLEDIRLREAVTRHDVKARIESFCARAGYEHIHKGLTSRDLTENVEQLQVIRSFDLLLVKAVALLDAFARRAGEFRDLPLTARTHNVPAQPTTLGRRMAMFGEELERGLEAAQSVRDRYPVRGLKGAVGTRQDQLTLFDGDPAKVDALEQKVAEHLGLPRRFLAVGQVYPRSLDFEVVSAAFQLSCGPSSFARTLRLMAGHELASEGFAPGQVGSSAMPHKMNSRSCERINGFQTILRGHLTMAAGLAGDQWNEGDVSCSVVRRVVLPDAMFALDGLLETTRVVLAQMEVYPDMITRETARVLPFLATTTMLMAAVKAGAGREQAHEAIKEHAVATVRDLRSGRIERNNLAERLAADPRLPLDRTDLDRILAEAGSLGGSAASQVEAFLRTVEPWRARYPNAAHLPLPEIL